jgi:4-hydroxythreonine-4-phosphate dehydrogenase
MALPLALTAGDPSGVGPEIAAAAWRLRATEAVPPFYLLTDPELMRARMPGLKLAVVPAGEADAAFADALPVVPLRASFAGAPGRPETANAAGIVESIERAVADVEAGLADALVTCPIAKKPLYDAGFAYPGHTEFLGHLAGGAKPVMMLAGPDLRAVPVTVHVALAEVPGQWGARTRRSCARPSPSSCASASTRAGRYRRTRCSTRAPAPPTTLRSACITIRR